MKRTIIKEGLALLKKEKLYDQVTVVRKLKHLNYVFAEATFTNILKDRNVKDKTLDLVSKGIQELIKTEIDYGWQNTKYIKLNTSGWEPIEVRKVTPTELSTVLIPGFVFHAEGRLTVQQKVDFFTNAKKEVIEFGVTLNTFSSYFISRKDKDFKSHVEAQLQKGVNFKCYMLDPECNEASMYFEDRRQEQKDEIKSIEVMRDIVLRLGSIKKDIDETGYPGTFEVFTYKHIPYNYFFTIDGGTPNGKMMISHYVYGLPRAKCPVMEFSKNSNHDLYMKYWNSLQKLTKNAKAIPIVKS
jgi:hypothetical protein